MVMLHIKLKAMKRTVTFKLLTPTTHRAGFKVQNIFLSESVHVAYQNDRKVDHTCTTVIYTMVGFGRSVMGLRGFL